MDARIESSGALTWSELKLKMRDLLEGDTDSVPAAVFDRPVSEQDASKMTYHQVYRLYKRAVRPKHEPSLAEPQEGFLQVILFDPSSLTEVSESDHSEFLSFHDQSTKLILLLKVMLTSGLSETAPSMSLNTCSMISSHNYRM